MGALSLTQVSALGESLFLSVEAGCHFTGWEAKVQTGQLALKVTELLQSLVLCLRGRQLHYTLQLPGLPSGGGASHHSDHRG